MFLRSINSLFRSILTCIIDVGLGSKIFFSEMEMEVNQTKLELNVTAGEKKFGLASF